MQIDEPLWTSAELSAACGALNARPWYADGVQVDSREVLPGDLFIALEGDVQDGHDFVADALKRGAIAALVSGHAPNVDLADDRLVHVADTLQTLALMAAQACRRAPAKRIAVTGTAGKTSVVQALRQALERMDVTHASIKSFNNHVGVPLSLARMPRGSRFGVFELGTSAPGEIRTGAMMVRPDVAVLTNVGAAHVGNFDGEAGVLDEKAAILEGLAGDGIAVIGMDHAHGKALARRARKSGHRLMTVSVESPADVRVLKMTEHAHCTCLTADVDGVPVTYKIVQPGREWVLNSLLILAAVKAVGADLGQAALALAALEAEPGRGRYHRLPVGAHACTLIDDSYNANPLSVRAALRRLSLVPVPTGARRIAVLADMQELGDNSGAIHRTLAGDLRAFGVDMVIAFGDQMAEAGDLAGVMTERWSGPHRSAERLMLMLRAGDAVMIKGANSAGLGVLVQELMKSGADGQAAPAHSPLTSPLKRLAE